MVLRSMLCTAALILTANFALAQKSPNYLALGDSIAYGFDWSVAPLQNGQGYPDIISTLPNSQFSVNNIAIPGETSGSFKMAGAGCFNCDGYRAALYSDPNQSQLSVATNLLHSPAGKKIKLVTIGIGANDLVLLQGSCAANANPTGCILSGLPNTLKNYRDNLNSILSAVRKEYQGNLVVVTYSSTDYQDYVSTLAIGALNAISVQLSAQYGAKIADGFTAFLTASLPTGGSPCTANPPLLNPYPAGAPVPYPPVNGKCDIHPNLVGHTLLANTVLAALGN